MVIPMKIYYVIDHGDHVRPAFITATNPESAEAAFERAYKTPEQEIYAYAEEVGDA